MLKVFPVKYVLNWFLTCEKHCRESKREPFPTAELKHSSSIFGSWKKAILVCKLPHWLWSLPSFRADPHLLLAQMQDKPFRNGQHSVHLKDSIFLLPQHKQKSCFTLHGQILPYWIDAMYSGRDILLLQSSLPLMVPYWAESS